jgi:mRNA interferase RelE/StbE
MSYRIIFSELAERRFCGLDKKVREQITKRLSKAAINPKPFVKGLTGIKYLSLRVGDYRVIMDIDESSKLIMVLDVGHRRDIYRKG